MNCLQKKTNISRSGNDDTNTTTTPFYKDMSTVYAGNPKPNLLTAEIDGTRSCIHKNLSLIHI